MDLTFIGHQRWCVQDGGTTLLIDPLVGPRMGHSATSRLEVFPTRSVYVEQMPVADAIFLSHEHIDHFHLPSLTRLPPRRTLVWPALPL